MLAPTVPSIELTETAWAHLAAHRRWLLAWGLLQLAVACTGGPLLMVYAGEIGAITGFVLTGAGLVAGLLSLLTSAASPPRRAEVSPDRAGRALRAHDRYWTVRAGVSMLAIIATVGFSLLYLSSEL